MGEKKKIYNVKNLQTKNAESPFNFMGHHWVTHRSSGTWYNKVKGKV